MTLAVLVACSSASETRGPSPVGAEPRAPIQTSDAPRPTVDPRVHFAAADARVLTPALREALVGVDPASRAAATLAVARLHDPDATPLLLAALADPDARVRQAASLGLAAFEDDAPATVRERLLGAFATESDLPTRAVFLADLGRVAGTDAEPALATGLREEVPAQRDAACRAVGAMGLRGRAVETGLLEAVATRVATDVDSSVRLACAWALGRQPSPPSPRSETVDALSRAVEAAAADADPELRLMAARAWGAHAMLPVEGLVALAGDADWRVVAQTFRSLARRSDPAHDGPFAAALRALLDARLPPRAPAAPSRTVSADAAVPSGPQPSTVDHGLRVALEEATPLATGVGVAPLAEEALRRLSASGSDAPRATALARCLAARLVDIAHGWPQRVLRCGSGTVSESERDIHAAEVLRRVSGDPAGRAGYLLRLYERGDVRVRESVLAATVAVDDVLATRLVLRGLREADVGVVTSALEAVVARPARCLAFRSDLGARPVPVQRDGGTGVDGISLDPALHAALVEAHARLASGGELEGLQTWLEAVAALGDTAMLAEVRALEADANAALRRKARATAQALETRRSLRRTGVDPEQASGDGGPGVDAELAAAAREPPLPASVTNPLVATALPSADARLRARFLLDVGEVEVELLPAEAPTTVARFVELAERGFYDGLRFHRVVPGFVVQGGDPRGDGYGGPGFSQRCEDNRVRYERGTVGMALAGRDTGGSQFFIAQSAQLHLDGRYTAFGRVVQGMEHVDAILPDDVVRRVRIVRENQ